MPANAPGSAVAIGTDRRGTLIARLTAANRIIVALGVVVCVILGAQVRAVAQHDGNFYKGGRVPIGADFVAFYGAGAIVAGGDGAHLYDLQRQLAAQVHTLARKDFAGFQPYPYPAFVAAPYAVLARMPFLWAYAINTILLLAAIIASVGLLRPVSLTVAERPLLVALAMLAWLPLSTAILGGQPVAFALLCFAGAYASLRRGRDVPVGIWLGLLLYKPQLAVPLLALLLWRRRWRVVVAAAAIGTALALIGVAAAGPDWPRHFVAFTNGAAYTTNEAHVNRYKVISLLGIAEHAFGPQSVWAYAVAGWLGVGAVALLLRGWRSAQADGPAFPLQLGLAIVVTLLISPHALFYDASLLILPAIALVDHWRAAAPSSGLTAQRRLLLVGLFLAGYLWPFGALFWIQPLALLPPAVGVLLRRASKGLTGPSSSAARTVPARTALLPRKHAAARDGVVTAPAGQRQGHLGGITYQCAGKALKTGGLTASRLPIGRSNLSPHSDLAATRGTDVQECLHPGEPRCDEMPIVTTVVIVDDHSAFGEQLRSFVHGQLRCLVVGVGEDAAAGLELVRQAMPDFALVDAGLPDEGGFRFAARVKELYPLMGVVLMGDGEPAEYVHAAARAGAIAYLPKTALSQRLPAVLGLAASKRAVPAVVSPLAAASRRSLVLEGALAGAALMGGLALDQPTAALVGAGGVLLFSRWQSARTRDRRDGAGARLLRQLRRSR